MDRADVARPVERWGLASEPEHVVEIRDVGLRRSVTWLFDGVEVATKATSEQRIVLSGGDRGAVAVRLPTFVGPARRVTWFAPTSALGAEAAAHAGVGGVDLDPEPGSKAAAREAWIREHPRRHTARRSAAAALGALVPLLATWLLSRIDIPLPSISLPSIPLPDWDLPSFPLPDVSIPWPDWDLPQLPEWLREARDKVKYVWPVLLAFVLARAELRRRRQQDAAKRAGADERASNDERSAAGD